MEIVPGIHQLKLPVPIPSGQLTDVNAYLVQGEDGCLLVDTGWNTRQTFSSLERQMAEIGVGVEDISLILITHFHPDHYGLVGKLKRRCQAKIALHRVERDFIGSRYISMDSLVQARERLSRAVALEPRQEPIRDALKAVESRLQRQQQTSGAKPQ